MGALRSLVAILMFVSSAWGGCRQADWQVVLDRGNVWATCNANEYMRGLWRHDNIGEHDERLGRIEFADCCRPPASYGNPDANCVTANWWSIFDRNYVWALCPSGRYMQGIYKTPDKWLHNLESGKCCKPPGHPNNWGHCYDHDVGLSFGRRGWSKCDDGYYMVGLWRGGCDKLYCIEKFRCCQMQEKVDGGWSDFGPWGECSAECGGGQQERRRTCTNPPPAHGGAQCSGPDQETQACNEQECPVDGGWGEYGEWGPCSKECDGGEQKRTRYCDNPPAEFGGEECSGSNEEVQACNEQPCGPVDGGWTDWSDYGECSEECGKGKKFKTRTCTNPPPSNGGKTCKGKAKKGKKCNNGPCEIPLEYVGCFFKTQSVQVLKDFKETYKPYRKHKITQACAELAKDSGFTYFGVGENRRTCFGGELADLKGDAAPNTKCRKKGLGKIGALGLYQIK